MAAPAAKSTPVPDPTTLTTDALEREISHLRGYLQQKIDDQTTLSNEKFKSVDIRAEETVLRHQQRFEAQTKALDAAFLSAQTAVQAALSAADKGIVSAMEASEKAVTKAEIAAEKRYDTLMELQKNFGVILAQQMPRSEAETRISMLNDKFESRLADMAAKIEDLKTYRSETTGKSSGIQSSWIIFLGIVGLIATMLTIVGTSIILFTKT